MKKPCLLSFPDFGTDQIGYISVAELSRNIPFEVKRVFWTYLTPEHITRGRHAHYKTEQIIIAVTGRILVTTLMPDGEIHSFLLDKPHEGVYIPPYVWHTIQHMPLAVQLVFASTEYNEEDYIRNFTKFKEVWMK
jgi:dTDP-4-dehydrorhamnose 3,5-epimerase-like enzyme